MNSRSALSFVAWTLIAGCGGTFTAETPGDGGFDASAGGNGGSAASTTSAGTTSTSTTVATVGVGGAAGGASSTVSTTAGGAGGRAGAGGTGGKAGAGSGGQSGAGGAAGQAGSTGTAGAAMDGGAVDWSLCTGAGQCSAELLGCCAPCATPELASFAGVNPKYIDAYHASTCPVPTPCPRCASFPNPYIGAQCVGTHCKPFDSRQVPEFSKCAMNTDCQLRNGLTCCQCGSQGPWTAVSVASSSALNAALCAPNQACADCQPVPPPQLKAVCQLGHCEVSSDLAGSCDVAPRAGCCFSDAKCMGRCYGSAACMAGSEGVCKAPPSSSGQCWGNQDCPAGTACSGARLCTCGMNCLLADVPGNCQ